MTRESANKILHRSAIELIFFGFYRGLQAHSVDSVSNGGAGIKMASTFKDFREEFNICYDDFSDNKAYKLVGKMTTEYNNLKKSTNDGY